MISNKIMFLEAISEIEENTLLFYQQKNKEGFTKLDGTLAKLIETISTIQGSNLNNIDEKKLNEILSNAMNAIAAEDTILLSDILYFDLKPIFEKVVV